MQRLHCATRSAPHSTSYQGEFDSSLYSRHFFHTGSTNQRTANQQIPIASEREVRKSHGDPSYLYSNTSRHFYGSAETRLVTNVNRPYDSEQPTPSSAASSSSSTSSYMPQTPDSAYDEMDRGGLSGIKEEVMDMDMGTGTSDATEYDGQYGYDPTISSVGMEHHVTNYMAHPTSNLQSPILTSSISNQSSSAWMNGFPASEEAQYGILPEESTRCVDIPYSSNNYPSHHPIYSPSDYHSPPARPLYSSSCPISSHSNLSTVSPSASFDSSPYPASSSYPSSSLYPCPSSYPPSSYSQTIPQSAHAHQQRVTVHQPRPYRPIPIISLSDLSSSNEFLTSMPETEGIADGIPLEEVDSSASTQEIEGLSLLCQPVSESVLAKFRTFPLVDDSESRCSSASVQSSDDMHMQYPPEISSHAFLGAPTSYNNNTTSTTSQNDLVCSCGCSESNLYRYSGSSVVCV